MSWGDKDPYRLPPNKAALGGFIIALVGFILAVSSFGYLIYLALWAYFTGGR